MKTLKITLFIFVFTCLAVSCVSAAGETEHKSGALAVMPVLYHMPETKLGYGAMGGYFKRLPGAEQASNVHGMFSYTELKQFNTLLMGEYYPANKKTYFMGYIQYLHFPDEFSGIGGKMGELEKYTADITIIELNPAYHLSDKFRIGPRLYYRKEKLPVIEEGKLLSQGAIPGSGGLNETGLGLTLTSDGRDNVLFTRKGYFIEASYLNFNGPFTTDYSYGILKLDYRKFMPFSNGSVLSFQGVGEFGRGEIPFQMLPRLGAVLRGYKKSMYRDNTMLAVQGEYKFGLIKNVMAAVFAGAGDVYGAFSRIHVSDAKFAGGAGLRVGLSKKEEINLRLDYAKNSEGGGELYFMIMEAF